MPGMFNPDIGESCNSVSNCFGPRVALSQANLSLGFPSKSSLFAWGNSPKLKIKAAWGKASEGELQISLGRSLGGAESFGATS